MLDDEDQQEYTSEIDKLKDKVSSLYNIFSLQFVAQMQINSCKPDPVEELYEEGYAQIREKHYTSATADNLLN